MADPRLSARMLLSEIVEEAQAAEQAGFDVCLFPEHHQRAVGSLTDPMAVTTWLLAHTERVQIGTGVLLLPLYHPKHVAEWSSVIHAVSGGRLVLGLGSGYQEADFACFDVDRETRVQRLTEGVRVLRAEWADEIASPTVWLGAWSRAGITRAAQMADGWISDPVRTEEEIGAMAGQFRVEAKAAGSRGEVVVLRELWVGESDEAAAAEYRPVIEPIYRYYLRNGVLSGGERNSSKPSLADAIDQRVICGSSETVARRLTSLVDSTGADWCVVTLRQPRGPSHESVLRAITRLAEEVLPAVRARVQPRAVANSK
jgi:alkanesulfonate monooxygenase SsuD/methylene tetrahydromethanopterin reductase-like flavin-dependent oxidoreductase (luciferase family)